MKPSDLAVYMAEIDLADEPSVLLALKKKFVAHPDVEGKQFVLLMDAIERKLTGNYLVRDATTRGTQHLDRPVSHSQRILMDKQHFDDILTWANEGEAKK
jgi:hypothetical protein